jgi:hypothetical protein
VHRRHLDEVAIARLVEQTGQLWGREPPRWAETIGVDPHVVEHVSAGEQTRPLLRPRETRELCYLAREDSGTRASAETTAPGTSSTVTVAVQDDFGTARELLVEQRDELRVATDVVLPTVTGNHEQRPWPGAKVVEAMQQPADLRKSSRSDVVDRDDSDPRGCVSRSRDPGHVTASAHTLNGHPIG